LAGGQEHEAAGTAGEDQEATAGHHAREDRSGVRSTSEGIGGLLHGAPRQLRALLTASANWLRMLRHCRCRWANQVESFTSAGGGRRAEELLSGRPPSIGSYYAPTPCPCQLKQGLKRPGPGGVGW